MANVGLLKDEVAFVVLLEPEPTNEENKNVAWASRLVLTARFKTPRFHVAALAFPTDLHPLICNPPNVDTPDP
jgi:hypothetical protein